MRVSGDNPTASGQFAGLQQTYAIWGEGPPRIEYLGLAESLEWTVRIGCLDSGRAAMDGKHIGLLERWTVFLPIAAAQCCEVGGGVRGVIVEKR